MEKLSIKIRVLEPLLISASTGDALLTASQNFISGTVIRGIFAQEYIKAKGLGRGAHKNKNFYQLFLSDNVCFVNGYPSYQDKKSQPVPLSLNKIKQKTENDREIRDLVYDDIAPGYKKMTGCAVIEQGRIIPVSIEKSISLHMDRSSERERISGKSEDGNIYNYESINAGQTFIGEIYGEKNLLEELKSAVGGDKGAMSAYMGRSKYTQYGKCSFELGDIAGVKMPEAAGQEIALYCETPFLAAGAAGSAEMAFGQCVDFLNTETGTEQFSLVPEKIFASVCTVENFVGIWGLRRHNEQAINSGSVFVIKNNGTWDDKALAALQKLLYAGTGLRCGEGFGQFRIWQKQDFSMGSIVREKAKKPDKLNDEVCRVVKNILKRKVFENIREFAYQDVESMKIDVETTKHIFSRMEGELGSKDNIENKKAADFTMIFANNIRPKSKAEKTLKNLKLRYKSIFAILTGQEELPYASKLNSWADFFGDAELGKLADEINYRLPDKDNGEVFYEYWLWFFRHGRKRLAGKREEG